VYGRDCYPARAARGLEKTVIRGLSKDSQWVQNHENLFVFGPNGVGKSYITCALAQKACRDHMYETGAMRRTHLRRHPNILKRLLIHAAAFNLGLLMRRHAQATAGKGASSYLYPESAANPLLGTGPA